MGGQDLGALYLRYRDTMHKVAASVLREAGLSSQAADAVQDTMLSIIASPPPNVRNWEALLVRAVKRKALDRIKSAHNRHTSHAPIDPTVDMADGVDVAEDVAADLDLKQRAAVAWDSLCVLDDRDRRVVWDVVALQRPGIEVAREHSLSPGRINQIVDRALDELRHEMEGREGSNEQQQ